ncbi:MAG TPA: hypothetical protein VFI06_03320 [Chitinophagaceae bacterium]|nr:hypothetical protein [Chitinophagaceae bacterium]
MYLNNPSISELQLLELPLLIEMLSEQTEEYLELLKQEGYTARTLASKEAVVNLQLVVEAKLKAGKRIPRKTDTVSSPAGKDKQRPNKLPK